MSLILITDNIIQKAAFEEAFLAAGIILKTYTTFHELKNIEVTDAMILAILAKKDIGIAEQWALKTPVFLFPIENIVIKDPLIFEEVLSYPVRLGQLVMMLKQALDEKEQHKALKDILMGDYKLNPKTGELSSLNLQKHVRLTEKEISILLYLYYQRPKAIPRQELLDNVWGYAKNTETHTLETHIYRLRQKLLKEIGLENFLITSNDGYSLNF